MTTQEVADTLVKLCSQSKFSEAMQVLYGTDIVSMEADGRHLQAREASIMMEEVAGYQLLDGKDAYEQFFYNA